MKKLSFVFYIFSIIWKHPVAGERVDLCRVVSPLVTPYFSPWLESHRKARGCFASPATTFKQDVHAVYLRNTDEKQYSTVLLNVSLENLHGHLVFLLYSNTPVQWKFMINQTDINLRPNITASQGSEIISHRTTINKSYRSWQNKKAFQKYIKRQFGEVSSYTEINSVNIVKLIVGKRFEKNKCNIHNLEESQVATAVRVMSTKTEGCFYENKFSKNSTNVYVVEIDAGKNDHSDRLPIRILLQRESSDDLYNITLVLKSHQPTIWYLEALSGFSGNVIVVINIEDQVENLGHHLKFHVKPVSLPKNLDDLLINVTLEYGTLVMYAKVEKASTVKLLVGLYRNNNSSDTTKSFPYYVSEEDLFSSTHQFMHQQPSLSTDQGYLPQTNELHTDAAAKLKASMIVKCGKTKIDVSFPANVVEQLGSPELSFADISCKGQNNKTHIILSTLTTSCASTVKPDARTISTTNYIRIRFKADNSSHNRYSNSNGYTDLIEGDMIPITCKNQPGFPVISGNEEDEEDDSDDDDDDDMESEERSHHNSLYQLDVYKEGDRRVGLSSLKSGVMEVAIGDQLFVKAWINGESPVQVMAENCWISNSSDPNVPKRLFILRNTCPAGLSAIILAQGNFKFQVTTEVDGLSLIYLHCRLGICTSDKDLTKGNLVLCKDPKDCCSHSCSESMSAAQQLVSSGPFRVQSSHKKHRNILSPIDLTIHESELTTRKTHTQIIHVGVSTAITITIALGSFAAGVLLTACLWFIHVRTDPGRHRHKQNLQPADATTMACSLSPHSGCSSINSQATVAT